MSEHSRDTNARARAELERRARSVCEEDVAALLEQRGALEARFDDEGPLARFADDANLLFALVRDYWTGVYPDVSWGAIATAAAALAQVVAPADARAELGSGVASVDLAAVVALGLASVQADLRAYERWLVRSSNIAPAGG